MDDFLSEDNLCGGTLLRIVSRGSSIIAELLRLSTNIPEAFLDPSCPLPPRTSHLDGTGEDAAAGFPGSESESNGYKDLLFDFHYLKHPEDYEKRINDTEGLLEVETDFQENHIDILQRYYTLFESIYVYQADLLKFVSDLQEGYYIQYSLDNVLLDVDGKQLMCEGVYLYGIMLIMLEKHIPGPIREKMIIAFYRYCGGQGNLTYIDEVCKLCKSTSYNPNIVPTKKNPNAKPKRYEDKLFSRFPLPRELVINVIGRLLNDDIYLMSPAFPSPEHRSTRLATQAGMLYVTLFFDTNMLHNDEGGMREIVDKHFGDNWIISVYMGHVIDISKEWSNFSAASAALANILTPSVVQKLHISNADMFRSCMVSLKNFLLEGLLTDQYVLDNTSALLKCLRECNVAVRWRMMHRRTRERKFYEIVCKEEATRGSPAVLPTDVMSLLLKSSQLEMKLKATFRRLLDTKAAKWEGCKSSAHERMKELSEYFTGEKALTRVKRNDKLIEWFAGMANEVESLSYEEEHATITGRKIQHCIKALEDVEQFDVIDTNMQIKAFLKDTRDLLIQMVRAVNIKSEVLSNMESITDMSYGWEVIEDFIPTIHEKVKKDPGTVVLLRALFLKLASILDVPILRIMQCNSPDTVSVAEYYSTELVNFVRRVMDVIPISVFKILTQIVDIKERKLQQLPTKIEIDQCKNYSQLEERYALANATHQVSIFTEGILAMEKTLLGVIQIDPRAILEDGLRREIVRQISIAMHTTLKFTKTDNAPLASHHAANKAFGILAARIGGFRRAIEYVQDYVDLAGLKIWQEELSRIMCYNVEAETNKYLQKKIFDGQSRYQSRAIPIPRFLPTKDEPTCVNFMGRVLACLLRMTEPQSTIYSPECGGWFTSDGQEVCGIGTFALLRKCVGISGLAGLDRLLSFRIVYELQQFLKFYRSAIKNYAVLLEQIRDGLFPEGKIPGDAARLYTVAVKKTEKLMLPLLTCQRRIGQAQLLKKMIGTELQFRSRLDANLLFQAVSTLDEGLMCDIKEHYRDPSKPMPTDSNPLLSKLSELLDTSGSSDCMSKIYITSDPLEGLPVLLLLFVVSYVPKLQYDKDFGALVRVKNSPLDGWPLVAGMATLLKQFHPSYASSVVAYLGQFVRSTVHGVLAPSSGNSGLTELPKAVANTLHFASQLATTMNLPRQDLFKHVPTYLANTIE